MAWAPGSRPFCCVAVQRLKTRAQFQAVLAGQRVATTTHFVLHRCGLATARPQDAAPVAPEAAEEARAPAQPALFSADDVWLGAMVPKRWARRAVTRNAIKRQIYAAGSRFESRLQAAAHVVRLRTSFDRKVYVSASSDALKLAVRQELEQLLARAALRSGVALSPARGVEA